MCRWSLFRLRNHSGCRAELLGLGCVYSEQMRDMFSLRPTLKALTIGGAVSLGAFSLGAFAAGALAVGAMAIGKLAIGKAGIGSLHIKNLCVDELTVSKLTVKEREGRSE
jgi:hypothetical protein